MDFAPMPVHDLLGEGKPQARPSGLGGTELLKEVLPLLRGDAGTMVPDRDGRSRCRIHVPGVGHTLRGDQDFGASR